MGDTITFTSPAGVPTFQGKGSRIQHPDVLPLFWGPYWPGTAPFSQAAILQAIRSLTSGPYLNGLKQYGYLGPVNVRDAMVVSYQPNVAAPTTSLILAAVRNMINALLDNDSIANVDDNHELIVAVFVDPSVPGPPNVTGENSSIEQFVFLDDNTRFEFLWVSTASKDLPTVLQTFSHELVESISDPFGNGWEQTSPSATPNQGQIGDVCNQNATVDGVPVVAYWSNFDHACIVPSSAFRQASLSSSIKEVARHDSPTRQAYVDLGKPLCSAGYFDYVERTYDNRISIRADLRGFESPTVTWSINGQPVPLHSGTMDVAAHWQLPPASKFGISQVPKATATLHTTRLSDNATEITVEVGPQEGNTDFGVAFSAVESFDQANLGGKGSTTRNASLLVEAKNQEILWGPEFVAAAKSCAHAKHLSDGPNSGVFGPRPGDPPDVAQILHGLLVDAGPNQGARILQAAELVRNFSVEISQALTIHAGRIQ